MNTLAALHGSTRSHPLCFSANKTFPATIVPNAWAYVFPCANSESAIMLRNKLGESEHFPSESFCGRYCVVVNCHNAVQEAELRKKMQRLGLNERNFVHIPCYEYLLPFKRAVAMAFEKEQPRAVIFYDHTDQSHYIRMDPLQTLRSLFRLIFGRTRPANDAAAQKPNETNSTE